MWGQFGSLTVLLLIAVACAFGVCVAFGLSSALARRFAPSGAAAKLGALVAAVSAAVFIAVANLAHGWPAFMAGLVALFVCSSVRLFVFGAVRLPGQGGQQFVQAHAASRRGITRVVDVPPLSVARRSRVRG